MIVKGFAHGSPYRNSPCRKKVQVALEEFCALEVHFPDRIIAGYVAS